MWRAASSAVLIQLTAFRRCNMAADKGYQDPSKGGNGPGKSNRVPFLPK